MSIEVVCCVALGDSQIYNHLTPVALNPLISKIWIIRHRKSDIGQIPKAEYVLVSDKCKPLRWLQMRKQCMRLARRPEVKAFISFNPIPYGIIAGTAGTPTTLAAIDLSVDEYDSTLINGHVLSSQTIREIRDDMLSMTSAQRLDLPGMEKGREDLIVTGTIMLEEFLDHCGFSELLVSDWGLLEGIAISAARDGRGYDLT